MKTKVEELVPNKGEIKIRKRKGRGNASGKGGECGRGHKGQKSRSGYSQKIGFEGGQTPLYKRLPKNKGFKNNFKEEYTIINVALLEELYENGKEITPDLILKSGYGKKNRKIKILGFGQLNKKFVVKAHKFSKEAEKKICAKDGKIEKIK
jgi:large subunit ribosomal protein L15